MYKFISLKYILTVLSITLICTKGYSQAATGIMMVVKGDVKVTDTTGKTESAKIGKKVTEGDTITAGPDSRAKIVMSDKNVLNISPDTQVKIQKYTGAQNGKQEVELNVAYGKIRADVEKNKYDGEKNKFNVRTPSAVAGVRGTDFITSFNKGTKVTEVITFHGTVAVGQPAANGAIANPVYVNQGQKTEVPVGAPPQPPVSVPANDLKNMNSQSQADSAAVKQPGSESQSSNQASQQQPQTPSTKEPDKQPVDKREPSNTSQPNSNNSTSANNNPPGGGLPNTIEPPKMPSMVTTDDLNNAGKEINYRPNLPPPPPMMINQRNNPVFNNPANQRRNPALDGANQDANNRPKLRIEIKNMQQQQGLQYPPPQHQTTLQPPPSNPPQ